MSMEQNGNQNMASPTLCRNGCGFYAATAFDGMCSKCYKDLKQLQPNESPVSAVQSPTASPVASMSSVLAAAGGGHSADDVDAVAAALSKSSITDMNLNSSSNPNNDKIKDRRTSPTSSSALISPDASEVETGSPTVATSKATTSADSKDEVSGVQMEDGDCEEDKGKKPKKNRCMECRKKVGLTGFQCHCGKLFCSLHRYSDTHDCTFDFKEKGQEEIRKNNPVVRAEKIQKI